MQSLLFHHFFLSSSRKSSQTDLLEISAICFLFGWFWWVFFFFFATVGFELRASLFLGSCSYCLNHFINPLKFLAASIIVHVIRHGLRTASDCQTELFFAALFFKEEVYTYGCAL